jgi:3'-phosphoadenosine 5'-phosphosulfate sulfotransferase (PAPS reductase)/FAD synthetase
MKRAIEIIKEISSKTDSVILFHSATGKDSIALLDLLYPRFKRVICAYMYVVKDLQHVNRYISYAQKKYTNATWVQIPHYGLFSDIKTGYLGHAKNESQKQYKLSDLTDIVRDRTGIEWVCYGFKKSDSMNRRLMLNTYRLSSINDKSRKFYPLADYLNKDVLRYIHKTGLINPERYGIGQSSGCDIGDVEYLTYLKEKFPNDLNKILREYPLADRLLFEKEYENKTE